ncbi:palmitoyl-(protein) hydrolase [Aureococcus anophagefferens]|uniref:Palmitoyl-(Protein) hydrolase n=1 Tax=Aureococcus anophagefferens TaxID=44056 RepID=A0ABR1FMW7_AURAN
MGALVSALAFPVPRLPFAFYNEELLRRDDLVWLYTSKREKIPACHVKASKRPHGNAEDLGLHLPFIDALARATGADVFSYEYVGYSLSRRANLSPGEGRLLPVDRRAWIYLTETLNIPANRIVVYGRSIGTGPSVDLVAGRPSSPARRRRGPAALGLLLQSPLESAIRCALGYGSSLSMYPLDIFKNYEKISVVCKARSSTARVGRPRSTRSGATRAEQGKPVVELFQKAGSA